MAADKDCAVAVAVATTGVGTKTSESESRWSSTSSARTELDDFWDDASALNHFYTTQDTAPTIDSFDFDNDNLFLGPFDSCSTGLSQYRTEDTFSHVTEPSTAGIESIDFASTQANSGFPQGLNPIIQDLPATEANGDAFGLSTWSLPMVDNDSITLKDRLNEAFARGDGGRRFLPDDAFRTILSHQSVSAELRRHFPATSAQELQRLASQITAKEPQGWLPSNGLLRIFAVLVLLDKVDKIVDLLQEGVSDMDLPLTKVSITGDGADTRTIGLLRKTAPDALRCFRGWSQVNLEAFENVQWWFLSPIFSDMAKEQEVDFLDLEDKTVLPYVESWEDKKQDHYKGGNSEVWKVKIHDAHHNFQNLGSVIPNNPYFAVKRLKSKDEEAFHREVRNLQRLHNAEHPNLLSLLATYKYRGYYHLVFPWADGDLRRLWQSTANPQPGKEEMRWLASQCASIASALKSVHAGAESGMNSNGNNPARGGDSGGQQGMLSKYGIHGDIKPENIFIFSKGQQKSFKALAMGPPTARSSEATTASERSSRSGSSSSVADDLVIGDFGGGLFYDPSTNPDPLRQITVAYRPPEYDTKLRPISRSWDVWGLGCTYLEFVTWFLLGPSGLTEFARRRTTRTAAGKMSDEYFETFIDVSQIGGIRAILKGPVLAWISELYCHKNASPFIRDFLDFITHRMFIIENANLSRASGAEVADQLNDLMRKCFADDAYCLPSLAVEFPGDFESTDSSIATMSSSSPDEFGLDFIAITDDAVSASTAAWDFSASSIDTSPLSQWNTAPILSSDTSTFTDAMSCADVLGSWNFTAPVAWNCDDSTSPSSTGLKKKRKREMVGAEGLERRVSPKTTTSSSSTTGESSPAEPSVKKTSERRFACPYYKNNPGKFRQKRTCCGPGWPTVHRVKEHLYRCHTIGKHTCSRCLARCKSAADLLAHQRAAVSCDTSTDAFSEGTMLPCQEETLRVKKRVPPNTTEEQRWNEVYLVLFPDEKADALPTPFYENDPPENCNNECPKQAEASNNVNMWCSVADYEEYLSRSLPPRVQRELEREVQREFGFVGDATQTSKVVDMVQKLQLRLFRQFESDRRKGSSSQQGQGGGGGGGGGG